MRKLVGLQRVEHDLVTYQQEQTMLLGASQFCLLGPSTGHFIFSIGINNTASLVAQLVKNLPAMQETPPSSWLGQGRSNN